jgi:phosphoglycerate dehydrogenase-like enzyme
MKILVSLFSKNPLMNVPDSFVNNLREEFPEIIFFVTRNKDALLKEIRDSDAIITYLIKTGWLKEIEKLRWVHFAGSGSSNLIPQQVLNSNIILTKSKGINANEVCEYVIALILALTKRLDVWVQAKLSGNINIQSPENSPGNLNGKVAGILGLGSIGQRVAKVLKGFNMKVIGTEVHTEMSLKYIDEIYPPDKYDVVLGNSDYIIITLPLTNSTRGMMGRNEFKMMKRSAFLINVSRGEIVQEDELIFALKEKIIAGAGLDVFKNEPLDSENELYKMENVIITPHVAGYSTDYWDNLYRLISYNIKNFINGKELKYKIDKITGF